MAPALDVNWDSTQMLQIVCELACHAVLDSTRAIQLAQQHAKHAISGSTRLLSPARALHVRSTPRASTAAAVFVHYAVLAAIHRMASIVRIARQQKCVRHRGMSSPHFVPNQVFLSATNGAEQMAPIMSMRAAWRSVSARYATIRMLVAVLGYTITLVLEMLFLTIARASSSWCARAIHAIVRNAMRKLIAIPKRARTLIRPLLKPTATTTMCVTNAALR